MAPRSETNATHWLGCLCGRDEPGAVPRALLVLAHPDDETVGAASLLPRLRLARFVYLTDGAPHDLHDAHAAGCATREGYASIRRGEVRSALESIGIEAGQMEFVDCADQEAVFHLVALTRWIEIALREHAPAVVMTHPYEGGHPDHDAAAFAVQLACERIQAAGERVPARLEFTSYHSDGAGGWRFGEFLSDGGSALRSSDVITHPLTAAECALKHRLIGCHASQRGVLRQVPIGTERFRIAPSYDFAAPQHPGTLLYEEFRWVITGAAWREAASRAIAALEPIGAGALAAPAAVA
jgi:N-acetylglucosamine malate deacetylase 2